MTLILCFVTSKIRGASKRPYFALTNAFTAVTLAVFLMEFELAPSLIFTAVFWVAGYLLYGILCIIPCKKAQKKPAQVVVPVQSVMQKPAQRTFEAVQSSGAPSAKNSVRLEHAQTVTEKLLTKNLSKADRQELEKLKNTLSVLQIKGNLSPEETEFLNENFNALLKLMAKYNV